MNRNLHISADLSATAGIAPSSWRAQTWRSIFLFAAWSFAAAGIISAKAGPIHASVSFPQEIYLTTPAANQPYLLSVIAADLNGDGLPDVIAASSQDPGIVAWYRNLGGGIFAPRQIVSTALRSPTGLFAADLDGDGLVDIACSSFLDNTVAWFKNLGGVSPSFALNLISTNTYHATSVAAANINGEPGLDVLSTSANPDNKLAWHRNFPAGTFGPQNILSTAGVSPSSISLSDLDGNGVLDLVVTSANDNSIAWFKGMPPVAGIPQFTRHVIATDQPRANAAAIADIDGDGWPDVLCATPYVGDAASGVGNRVTWFRNTTHDAGSVAPFFGAGQVISGYAQGASSVAAADLNSDGRPDAVAACLGTWKVTWYENLGGGNFGWNAGNPAANENVISAPYFQAAAVATADFNQDGTIDVVAGTNDDAGNVVVYPNRGGQCALASASTAPATIGQGVRDDVLRIAVSSRGVAGDNNAQLYSLTLLLEKAAGVSMTTAEANALIENLYVYVDTNNSGVFELGLDSLVGTVADLQLTAGRLVFPLTNANAADVQIAPGITRNYFVVPQMTLNASTQNPSSFRITHVGQGAGRSVTKDATSGAVLTVEYAANPDAPSSMVSATVSPLQQWRQTWFFTMANSGNAADSANPDGDASINIVEFAFGTNPTVGQSGAILVNSPTNITPGSPATSVTNTQTGVDYRALYGRRKDYEAAGLTYTVEFSPDLVTWVASADIPTVIADNNVMQAVTVPYPLFINGKKARFFHVIIIGP